MSFLSSITVGVSTNSCSVVYPGHEPMSELEIKAVTKFIMSDADRIFGYLSVHSFGQLVLSRWAYVNDTPPDNEELVRFCVCVRVHASVYLLLPPLLAGCRLLNKILY